MAFNFVHSLRCVGHPFRAHSWLHQRTTPQPPHTTPPLLVTSVTSLGPDKFWQEM
jgi:hypothetical protein